MRWKGTIQNLPNRDGQPIPLVQVCHLMNPACPISYKFVDLPLGFQPETTHGSDINLKHGLLKWL